MITEDYVSFEIAKLLKEKGLEGSIHTFYTEKGTEIESAYVVPSNFFPIYRPTLQMAMKWLRENHNIQIVISPYNTLNKTWSYYISKNFESLTQCFYAFKTYEEACEAGIKYCLENLI